MFSYKLTKNYIRKNTANSFIDENHHQGYTVVKNAKFYKVPAANVSFWFPEDYGNGKITGRFQKFVQQDTEFFAVYKSNSDGTDFMVNKKLEIVE